jgi:hypothetical protein
MVEVDNLDKIQARNRVLLEEMGEEARRYLQLLTHWEANPTDEDLRAELETQIITLRIHAEVLERSLEDELEAMPEDE